MKVLKGDISTGMQAFTEKRITCMAGKWVTRLNGDMRQASGEAMGIHRHCLGLVSEVGEMCPFGFGSHIHNDGLLEPTADPARRPGIGAVSIGYANLFPRAIVCRLPVPLDEGGGSGSKIAASRAENTANPPPTTARFLGNRLLVVLPIPRLRPKYPPAVSWRSGREINLTHVGDYYERQNSENI
jgi:hypothetical protein